MPWQDVKVVVLGDMGVGKTSLVERFCLDRFRDSYNSTIGMKPYEKVIHAPDMEYKVYIWDTAGQERYRSVTSHFVVRAMGCLLVFDVMDPESLNNALNYWYVKVKEWDPDLPIVLVANKVDRVNDNSFFSTKRRALTFCKENNIHMYETSARTGDGVVNAFLDAANVLGNYRHDPKDEDLFMRSIRLTESSFELEEDGVLYPERRKKKGFSFKCC
ncbi:rab-like protein 2B [Aplysia californica]|uniref:Rab-like protein 2B n=1 Tax=Aplysia californica TaxID=6500 RepID=A0ABM0JMD5_APLCA|nr:rab-like protein 2B [Aplysia californica]